MNGYEKHLFETRYKDIGSNESSWRDVLRRVCDTIGADAAEREAFFAEMSIGTMLPSSPQLWNYGAKGRRFPRNGSSCFTGRMGDTLEDFRAADGDAEAVYVASGGMGFMADRVRPRGCKIRHCSEGAMGSMCQGGPIRRIEGTTGYITGAGRARGAMMIQLGIQHPDVIEFILAKRPTPLSWLDDWPANAKSKVRGIDLEAQMTAAIDKFSTLFLHRKDWPSVEEVENLRVFSVQFAVQLGVVRVDAIGRVIPQVTDWMTESSRDANRDWELPLQNCNMSVRIPDAFMKAVENDAPWTLSWFDRSANDQGDEPWTKTDALGDGLAEIHDGRVVVVDDSGNVTIKVKGSRNYRYGVVITTWEGLAQNMSPNRNQWRDSEYSRFYRQIVYPAISAFSGRIMAKQLWSMICENAWNHADPGVVFSDTYERFQPVDSAVYGPRLSNPCSEYVNSEGGSCNLISVNLRRCAEVSTTMEELLQEVSRVTRIAALYIHRALEYNRAPVEFIDELTSQDFRTVGIGMMGLAELLMLNSVRYGSSDAQQMAAAMMSEIGLTAWETSFELAAAGAKIPKGWAGDKMATIFRIRAQNTAFYCLPKDHEQRWLALSSRSARGDRATNTAVTSVAPTGTIAQIAAWIMRDCDGVERSVSSGVEPTFAWFTGRTDNSGSTETSHDLWENRKDQSYMVTASDVSMYEHIEMQAAVCAFTDMSVSKTVNIPEGASVQDVMHGYELAHALNIPGTSIYRDRSKPMQVLTALECPSGECAIPRKNG